VRGYKPKVNTKVHFKHHQQMPPVNSQTLKETTSILLFNIVQGKNEVRIQSLDFVLNAKEMLHIREKPF
jgi:hypothetical protein